MLKLRFKNNKLNAVWLVEPKVTIGRSATNDLVVDEPGVVDNHAEILVKYENLTLVNLTGAADSVAVNGRPVEESCSLNINDQVTLGSAILEVIDPKQERGDKPAAPAPPKTTGWALKANSTALGNRVFPLKPETVVGRSNECDITLAAAHLSRRHVQLTVLDGVLYAKDLGSANGTYLNGQRITEARVNRGDELRFDTLSFGVIGPSQDLDRTTVRPVSAVTPAAIAEKATRPGAGRGDSAALGNNGQAAARKSPSPHSRPTQRAANPRAAQPSHPYATEAAASGGRGKVAVVLAVVLVALVAGGIAYTQGLLPF